MTRRMAICGDLAEMGRSIPSPTLRIKLRPYKFIGKPLFDEKQASLKAAATI